MTDKKIQITKEEAWHIIQTMNEREVGHCKFCANLLKKLKEKFEELSDNKKNK